MWDFSSKNINCHFLTVKLISTDIQLHYYKFFFEKSFFKNENSEVPELYFKPFKPILGICIIKIPLFFTNDFKDCE